MRKVSTHDTETVQQSPGPSNNNMEGRTDDSSTKTSPTGTRRRKDPATTV